MKNNGRRTSGSSAMGLLPNFCWRGGYLRGHAEHRISRICRQFIPKSDGSHGKRSRDWLDDEWRQRISRHPVRGSAGGRSALDTSDFLREISGIYPPSDSVR
jgi:hypothetical protein